MRDTQNDLILTWLRSGRPLTPIDALREFGCFRLAARIRELREQGEPIQSRLVRGRATANHAVYWL